MLNVYVGSVVSLMGHKPEQMGLSFTFECFSKFMILINLIKQSKYSKYLMNSRDPGFVCNFVLHEPIWV